MNRHQPEANKVKLTLSSHTKISPSPSPDTMFRLPLHKLNIPREWPTKRWIFFPCFLSHSIIVLSTEPVYMYDVVVQILVIVAS